MNDDYHTNYSRARKERAKGGVSRQQFLELAQKYEDRGNPNAARAIRDVANGKPRRS